MVKAEIKCVNCGEWNKEQDYCLSCGQPISQVALLKKQEKEKQSNTLPKKRDEIEESLEKLKNHRFLLIRSSYHIVYSTFWLFWIISSVFSMIVAFLSA